MKENGEHIVTTQKQIDLVNEWVAHVIPKHFQTSGFETGFPTRTFARSADETNDGLELTS